MPPLTQIIQFAKNHLFLIIAFAAVLGLILFEELKKNIKSSNSLSPQEAVNLINHEETVVVDIRDHAAFSEGHIVNAINIPKAELEKNMQKLHAHKNKTIILIAAAEQDSKKIFEHLKKNNFNKIYILANGISAWQNASLPLIKNK